MSIRPPETPSSGLGSMLSQDHFVVPNHQRDYSWTGDEINQLFDDLTEAISEGDQQYFLGLMVCMPKEDVSLIVLDGQQRLATTVIFFSAIRAWLEQYDKHKEDAQQISEDFIGRRKLGGTAITPKLNLNSANNPYFQKYVVDRTALSEVEKEIKKLKKQDRNFKLLNSILISHRIVRKIADDNNDSTKTAKALIDIVEYITDNVRVVRFIVEDDSTAYTIFETLNDRGLDLATIDLVKNHIFGRISNNQSSRIPWSTSCPEIPERNGTRR